MIYLFAAILMVLIAALLWVPVFASVGMGRLPAEMRRQTVWLKWLVLLAAGFWMVYAILTGSRLDYDAYQLQWQIILDAQAPPWGEHSSNAYGPLYNLLALPYRIDPFLPKLLMVFAWMWAALCLIRLALKRADRPAIHAWLTAAFMLLGPALALLIAHYGYFDILPAGLCLVALHLRLQKRDTLSAAALAGAVLLKYYPIALLPFLMLDRRRLRIRLGVWCVVFVGLGMLASGWVWGESTLHPLTFAGERPSKWLSIFRFLRGPYSPLSLWMENPDADHLSLPALVLFTGATWLVCWWRRVPLAPACVAGIAVALQFYKVGHIQFQILLMLLILYWLVTGGLLSRENRPALVAVIAYLLWLTVFVCVYVVLRRVSREDVFISIRDYPGLIGLIMTLWLAVAAIKSPKPPDHEGAAGVAQNAGPVV